MTMIKRFAGFVPGTQTEENPLGTPRYERRHPYFAGAQKPRLILGRAMHRGIVQLIVAPEMRQDHMRAPTGNRERARRLRQQEARA